MKKITFIVGVVLLITSCNNVQLTEEVTAKYGDKNHVAVEQISSMLNNMEKGQLKDLKTFQIPAEKDKAIGEEVDLYRELVDLFDPDNFSCGLHPKIKKKLKKLKARNKDVSGFVPNVVIKNAYLADSALLLDRSGSNILAHGFQYKKRDGTVSKFLFARTAPTVEDFNQSAFMEKDPNTYDYFLYTMDCSGFLSASVSATAGLNRNALKTSASAAGVSDKSLVVLGGLLYSPLLQAYKGEGIFSGMDSVSLIKRINTLQAILNEIPDGNDTTQLLLNANFEAVMTSNSGSSGFNGEAKLDVTGSIGFGVGSGTGAVGAKANVERKSEFSRYKTYILRFNVGAAPPKITLANMRDLIRALNTQLDNLDKSGA
ncbi:MAG: hypothetical protein AAFZ15_00175 [Bacteroidota bacterium]